MAVDNIADSIKSLYSANADFANAHFLVVTVPDIGKVPEVNRDRKLAKTATSLSKKFNDKLSSNLASLQSASCCTDINITMFNFFDFFNTAIIEEGGFSNTRDACITAMDFDTEPDSTGTVTAEIVSTHRDCDTGSNDSINEFVFIDSIHLTALAHYLIGRELTECFADPSSDYCTQPEQPTSGRRGRRR